MRRREFIAGLGGAAAWSAVALAQQGERVRRVGVLMQMAESDQQGQLRVAAFRQGLEKLGWTGEWFRLAEAAAGPLAVELTAAAARDDTDIEEAVAALSRDPNGGLIVDGDAFTSAHRERIIAVAASHRLPAIYPFRFYAADGGLISYGTDMIDQYRQAASYVDRVLQGEKPANLPVQAPTKFEMIINLSTAKVIGVEVSRDLLSLADEVIE